MREAVRRTAKDEGRSGRNPEERYWESLKGALGVLIVVALLLAAYGVFLNSTGANDFVDTRAFSLSAGSSPSVNFSFWPVSHFLLYLGLGMAFPEVVPELFVVGILFEFFEDLVGWVQKEHFPSFSVGTPENSLYADRWMRGNGWDIIFNAAGLLVGAGMTQTVRARRPVALVECVASSAGPEASPWGYDAARGRSSGDQNVDDAPLADALP